MKSLLPPLVGLVCAAFATAGAYGAGLERFWCIVTFWCVLFAVWHVGLLVQGK